MFVVGFDVVVEFFEIGLVGLGGGMVGGWCRVG